MKKILLPILLLGMMALLITSCKPDLNDKELTVKVGYFPNITHAQALLGKESEFAAAIGYPIEWKKFNAGSTEIEALMAGELDMGYIGPGPAINGYIKTGGEIQIIAGACKGGAVLVSRRDIVIKDLKDLNNKKIAVPQYGNTQHVVLKQLLDDQGLKETSRGGTVEIVQVENPDVKTLFDRQEIEAAFVPEPWASILVNESEAQVVLDYNEGWRNGDYPVAVLIARTDFIKQHPEIVQKFLQTHTELTALAENDPAASKQIINKEIKRLTGKEISPDIMNSAYERLIFDVQFNQAAVLDMADIMKQLGFIKDKSNLNDIFNLNILDE
ncbi:aliphatic sulfonate ABC transporter substrate-binding protein [Syntrophomonas wolfei]|uniref:aliphatic sulfonate ABC transporter substrate-binding protein n=1 Tax=Syntrophomonas wolfei TaxID=863 RepID=UPI0023F06ABF|nr:aliphatic sulfonate ABC transporter substrate-binding protein [Syntrophomonas wolfei]